MMVGDEEGVVCVPRHLAQEIAEAAHEQEDLERFIQEEIANGKPLRGTYPPDEDTFERYHEHRSRGSHTPRRIRRPREKPSAVRQAASRAEANLLPALQPRRGRHSAFTGGRRARTWQRSHDALRVGTDPTGALIF